MELQDSVKALRREIGMTQAELAAALHLSSMTVTRWETGRTVPQPKAIRAILKLAKQKKASPRCIKWLEETLRAGHREVLRVSDSELYPVERESICQLVDDSVNAIYVTDMETDELLYVNHKAAEYIGKEYRPGRGIKCYQYLYGIETPCEQCPKKLLAPDETTTNHVVSPSGRHFNFKGRSLTWNGRPAHVQYFYDETAHLERQGGMNELVETLPVGVCTFYVHDSGDISMQFMSEGYFKVVGSTRADRARYAGYGVMNALYEPDRPRVTKLALDAAHESRDFVANYSILRDDGTLQPMTIRAAFIRREAQKALYHCVVYPQG